MQGKEIEVSKTLYKESSLTSLQTRLIESIVFLFCSIIVLSIISLIVNIKRRNKKRIIYQIVLSVIILLVSCLIIDKSIILRIFGADTDLYIPVILLSIGNILTLINIFKKN